MRVKDSESNAVQGILKPILEWLGRFATLATAAALGVAGIAMLTGIDLFGRVSGDGDQDRSWVLIAGGLLTLVVLTVLDVFGKSTGKQEDPSVVLRHRIREVNSAFETAADLMDELRREVATQEEARRRILAEAEEQQRLLEVDQEQAEKVRHILLADSHRDRRRQRRRELVYFAAGVLASVTVSLVFFLLQ
ncbi:hypothetical protein GCM10029992_09710 [Glycomyces albus]